ncbi:MAG TPA: hypothetical protein VFZ49_03990, partial [Pyrinomonadaceae bacterium]
GLQIFTEAAAPEVFVDIEVDPDSRIARVTGRFADAHRHVNPLNIIFKREVAGEPNLGARISELKLTGRDGTPVGSRKLMDGEYLAVSDYASWSYAADLTPAKDRAAAAHASWLSESGGILMLDDLLPHFQSISANVTLELPPGWTSISADDTQGYDLQRSVIVIGKDLRTLSAKARHGELTLQVSGEWHFTADEAAEMAREIFDEYSQILGKLPAKPYLIAIQRFPTNEPHGHWEAETRGRSVTILSSDMPFRTQSLQRLHEQLRHEIFHLWFPNGVKLSGDYAWFYEGFAMYSSLKLAVELNRIRFDDFLDTLGRAYTIDANAKPRKALTDPSIDPTVRYARGMLIAFITDLDLLRNSGGRDDVNKKLKKLFARHSGTSAKTPANEAVRSIVASYLNVVDGGEPIEWTAELAAAGIEAKRSGRTTTLTVVTKPNGRQRAILDRLGYNNWRKIGNRK